jgi:putative cell wall-binding protein
MKKLLAIMLMSCSLLLASSVSYASDGEKTTKSEVVIVGADNLNIDNIVALASDKDVKVVVVASEFSEIAFAQVASLEDVMIRKERTLDDLCNDIIASASNYNDLYCDIPIDVGFSANNHFIERHNKALYNSKVKAFNTGLFKSDLLRSNSSFRC